MTSLTDRDPRTGRTAERPDEQRQNEANLGTLQLGYLGKPHGLAGELRLVLHNPDSEALDTLEQLILERDSQRQEFPLLSVRGSAKAHLVRLGGIDSREAAEAWKGATVLARRSEMPPLEEGEYYLSDLLGARVEGPEGFHGEVIDLAIHPTVDSLIIRSSDGRRLEQPLLEPWLEFVDAQQGVVRLRSLDGLIE